MAQILVGKEQLINAFSSTPSDKKIGGIGAFYYPGKKLTAAHFVNFAKMKKLCDITYLVIFYTGVDVLNDGQIDSLVQSFAEENQNLLVDYVYFDRDTFKIPKKYQNINELNANIENTSEWKWFVENTDLLKQFGYSAANQISKQALINIFMFPRETERIGKLIDNQISALSGKNVMWFRGICEYTNDLRTVGKAIYSSLPTSELYEQYKKSSESLYTKRIYLPVVSFPTGRIVHNTHLLRAEPSAEHIFVKVRRDFDISKSTIEQLIDLVSSNMGESTGFAVYNFEGKTPTTDDLKNKKVFLNVFSDPLNVVDYEPGGEVMWVGSTENDIFEIDYLTGTSTIKTVSGLDEPDVMMKNSYNSKCSDIVIHEAFEVLKNDLYNAYK